MMWLAFIAGSAVGFFAGFLEGMKVRADMAMRAIEGMRRAMRWAAVRARKAQEARARHIAAHADEWDQTKRERGDTCA
jgi:hypothetical protein